MFDFIEENNEIAEIKDKDEELAEELGLLENDQEENIDVESAHCFSIFKTKRKGKPIGHETIRTYNFCNSSLGVVSVIKKDYNKPFIIAEIEKRIIAIIEQIEFDEKEAKIVQELIDNDKIIDILNTDIGEINILSRMFTDDLFTKLYSNYINYISKEEKDITSFKLQLEEFKLKELKEIRKITGEIAPSKPLEKGLYNCKKCQSYDVKLESKQIRSSDEPETLFVDCKQCGHRQRYG